MVFHKSTVSELYVHEYPEGSQYRGPDPELTNEHLEYVEEPEEEPLYNDEVLDIEINEPLDEFTVSLFPLCTYARALVWTGLKPSSFPGEQGKLDLIIAVCQFLYQSPDKVCVDSLFGQR